jgi:membrane protein YdbS with pleckstrin-like domain
MRSFAARIHNYKNTHMKSLLKNLGLILIVIGTIILLVCSFTGDVNNNVILGSSAVLMVLGLILYIAINKRIAD